MIDFIDQHRPIFGVEPICQALAVAPSTYYAARCRPPSARAVADGGRNHQKVVAKRGFGFIAAEDDTECFFHRGGLDPSFDFHRLVCGERVGFDAETGTNSPHRVRVHGV